ncbi:MAG: RDD family protein [Planctomycetes bacterium]|nr:RDD family protein [Planctomycetota bacterium]
MSNASAEESSPTSSVSNDPFSPPRSNVEVTESGPFAGPWRRYLARSLDCTVGAGLTMYAAIAALGLVDVSKIDFDSRLVQQTVGMMAILISLAIDAAIYGVFKSTIGKALLRIRVVDATGARLSVAAYAKRNLRVWVSGFGLGIPLITLIAMLRQYGRLKARKPATYDEGLRTRVLGESVGVLRVASAIVLYLVVFSLITLQVGATDIVSAVRVLRSRGDAPPQAWRNAATRLDTMIDGFWT